MGERMGGGAGVRVKVVYSVIDINLLKGRSRARNMPTYQEPDQGLDLCDRLIDRSTG